MNQPTDPGKMAGQNRSHSERSVAVGEGGGDTESKNPVYSQETFGQDWTSLRHSTGFFTPRLVPRRSVQNDRVWGRFIGSGAPRGQRRGGAESKDPVELKRDANREVHGILRSPASHRVQRARWNLSVGWPHRRGQRLDATPLANPLDCPATSRYTTGMQATH